MFLFVIICFVNRRLLLSPKSKETKTPSTIFFQKNCHTNSQSAISLILKDQRFQKKIKQWTPDNSIEKKKHKVAVPLIVYPCNYTYLHTNIGKELETIYTNQRIQSNKFVINPYYMGLENVDELVGKDHLWQNVLRFYHNNHSLVETYLPKTYILKEKKDHQSLTDSLRSLTKSNFEKIMDDRTFLFPLFFKTNSQRKEGIHVANNVTQAWNILQTNPKVIIAQHQVSNAFRYKQYATTLRIYVLGIYHFPDNKTYFYQHSLIKCLYGTDNVTTSNKTQLERLYEREQLPMTLKELYFAFSSSSSGVSKLHECIKNTLSVVFRPFSSLLGQNRTNLNPNTTRIKKKNSPISIIWSRCYTTIYNKRKYK